MITISSTRLSAPLSMPAVTITLADDALASLSFRGGLALSGDNGEDMTVVLRDGGDDGSRTFVYVAEVYASEDFILTDQDTLEQFVVHRDGTYCEEAHMIGAAYLVSSSLAGLAIL